MIEILFDQIHAKQRRILACTILVSLLVFCDLVFLSNGKVHNFPNSIIVTFFFSSFLTVLTFVSKKFEEKMKYVQLSKTLCNHLEITGRVFSKY